MSSTVISLPRRRVDGRSELALELEVVTPIFGGSPVTREVDRVDVIRAASIRGSLRFWWRALYAHKYADDSGALYRAEAELWGGPTRQDEKSIGRSKVELRVDVHRPPPAITRGVPTDPHEGYALFPARNQQDGTPAAQVREQGTRFVLRVRVPSEHQSEIRDAVRAWVLFGGYGGRTRRGLGALTVVEGSAEWLPTSPNPAAINALFGRDIFAAPTTKVGQTPALARARMFSSFEMLTGRGAWSKAVGWLCEFRQGSGSPDGARRPGGDNRPSISNWPEADKVRHLSTGQHPWAHEPRHNQTPAWPRAGFGLPIVGQFQAKTRNKQRWEDADPPRCEPEGFTIGWRDRGGTVHDRLASPLIVKPLAIASDSKKPVFSPIALWLNRASPDGEVVLSLGNDKIVRNSAAEFEQFLAPGDEVFFEALRDKPSLRDAFFAWLDTNGRPQQSAGTKTKNRRPR